MASFPNFNSSAMFDQAWAPGGIGFQSAIKYYQDQLKQNGAGKGLPQLASGQASDAPAAGYARQPFAAGGPGQDAALNAYGAKAKGLSDARSAGRATAGQVGQTAIQGANNVASDYGNSLVSHIEGEMALNQAEAASAAGGIGGALGLGDLGNSVLGAFFDPANASGSFGKSSGAGAFLTPGKSGNMFGLPAAPGLGSLGGGSGASSSTGNSSTYSGYTTPSPGAAANLAQESQTSFPGLTGSDIAQIGPSASEGTGLLSWLGSLFTT